MIKSFHHVGTMTIRDLLQFIAESHLPMDAEVWTFTGVNLSSPALELSDNAHDVLFIAPSETVWKRP